MPHSSRSVARYFQAWTCLALLVSGAFTVSGSTRLQLTTSVPRRGAETRPALTPVPSVNDTPIAEMNADPVFARLELAETSDELCELLDEVPASDDPTGTYAITAVLGRVRFRSVRACGTAALTKQPNEPARSWLTDLAEDPDPDVHRVALDALAAKTDDAAQSVVAEAAHSDDLGIRSSAVMALLKAQRAGAVNAAKPLLATLQDASTRLDLIDALGDSHDATALPTLVEALQNGDRDAHLHAISAIGALGAAAGTAALAPLLEIGSIEEFRAAANALASLAPDLARSRLIAILETENIERRAIALATLMSLKGPDLTAIVSEQLRSKEPRVILVALRRLVGTPNVALEADVIALLGNDDPSLVQQAKQTLLSSNTPTALAAVSRLAALGEPDSLTGPGPSTESEVRARFIAELQRENAPDALAHLVADGSEQAQTVVLDYLVNSPGSARRLGDTVSALPLNSLQSLIDRQATLRPPLRLALIEAVADRGDPQLSDVLRNAARDEDEDTRHAALRGLVALGGDESRRVIEQLATATSSTDRSLAVELLGNRSGPGMLGLLESLTVDSDSDVASNALGLLQNRAPERAAQLAERAYGTASSEARVALLSNLSNMNARLALQIYDRALRDGDDDSAIAAVNAIAARESPASAQRLLAVATDPGRSNELRSAAADGLFTLGGPLYHANRALIDALRPSQTTTEYTCNPW